MNEKGVEASLSRLSQIMGVSPFLCKEIRFIQQRWFTDQMIDLNLCDIANTGELIYAARIVYTRYTLGGERAKYMAYIRDSLFMAIYRIFHEESPDLSIVNAVNKNFKNSLNAFAYLLDLKMKMTSNIIQALAKIFEQQNEKASSNLINVTKRKLHLALKGMKLTSDFKELLNNEIDKCDNAFFAMNLLEKIYKYFEYTHCFNKVDELNKKYFLKLMMDLVFNQKTSDLISCLEEALEFFDFPNLSIISDMMKYIMNEMPCDPPKKQSGFKFFAQMSQKKSNENYDISKGCLDREQLSKL